MARLILSLDNQVLAEYNMSKERYTIGRLPDNDVRIDNPAVSGHHSLIINILNDSFLEDLNSTNGTYVNGKLIKKHALQHGDVITIGHHQLRFSEEQATETDQDEFEKTMVIPANEQNPAQLAMAEKAADEAVKASVEAIKESDEESRDASEATAIPVENSEVKLDQHEVASLMDTSATKKAKPETVPETVPQSVPEMIPHDATTAGVDPRTAPSALPMAKMQVLSGAFAGRELER